MFESPAYAQAAGGAAAAGGTAALIGFLPYLAIFAIFYFLIIRPQQNRVKQQRAMVDAVKKGDDVITGGGYTCSEDVLGIVTLARAGAGIVQTYRFIVERDLEQGTLVELLAQHGGTSRPFYLLYPHARHLSLRVRTFVDFVSAQLALGKPVREVAVSGRAP